MTTLLRAAILLAAGAAQAVPAAALPEELAQLSHLGRDRDALIQGVRDFDRLQRGLAQWDMALAREYAEAGERQLAKDKQDNAQWRLDLIRTAYEEALRYDRTNPALFNFYGELLYDGFGDKAQAVRKWEFALVLDPEYAPAMNNLGIHYCHEGEYLKGVQHFKEALRIDPENPDYLFNMVQTYLVHGPQVSKILELTPEQVFERAIAMSEKSAELAPDDFEIQKDYAVNFFAADNFDVIPNWRKAARAWQQARTCARTPDEVFYTHLNEARVWRRLDDTSKTRACLEEALAIRPDSPVARAMLDELDGGDPSASGAP